MMKINEALEVLELTCIGFKIQDSLRLTKYAWGSMARVIMVGKALVIAIT